MDSHIVSCRGTLTLHKDASHMCSASNCLQSHSPELALSMHSCVVLCNEVHCVHCARQTESHIGKGLDHTRAWLN
jgi:hypothetical protein